MRFSVCWWRSYFIIYHHCSSNVILSFLSTLPWLKVAQWRVLLRLSLLNVKMLMWFGEGREGTFYCQSSAVLSVTSHPPTAPTSCRIDWCQQQQYLVLSWVQRSVNSKITFAFGIFIVLPKGSSQYALIKLNSGHIAQGCLLAWYIILLSSIMKRSCQTRLQVCLTEPIGINICASEFAFTIRNHRFDAVVSSLEWLLGTGEHRKWWSRIKC